MKILVSNRYENIKVEYDALGYDPHMAIETENGYEPVFHIILPNNETATFRKSQWELYEDAGLTRRLQ